MAFVDGNYSGIAADPLGATSAVSATGSRGIAREPWRAKIVVPIPAPQTVHCPARLRLASPHLMALDGTGQRWATPGRQRAGFIFISDADESSQANMKATHNVINAPSGKS